MSGDEQRAKRRCSASGHGRQLLTAARSTAERLGQLIVRFPDGSEKRLADTSPDEIIGALRDDTDGNFFFGPYLFPRDDR
jgi:hypothetical protein